MVGFARRTIGVSSSNMLRFLQKGLRLCSSMDLATSEVVVPVIGVGCCSFGYRFWSSSYEIFGPAAPFWTRSLLGLILGCATLQMCRCRAHDRLPEERGRGSQSQRPLGVVDAYPAVWQINPNAREAYVSLSSTREITVFSPHSIRVPPRYGITVYVFFFEVSMLLMSAGIWADQA